jgi:hypothetical protein
VLGMEVEAHNARLCGEDVFWVGGVLETVAADEPAGLPHEVEAAVPVGRGERLRFRKFKMVISPGNTGWDEPAKVPYEVEAAVSVGTGERFRFREFENATIMPRKSC